MTTNVDDVGALYREAVCAENAAAIAQLGAILDAHDEAERQQEAAPDYLMRGALWYARRGIPVFPLRPRSKEPATPHGFKDALTAEDRIVAYWTRHPDANIGLPTGGLFDVIDVDGPEGCRSWAGFAASLPPLLGQCSTARPEGGGWHLYVPATGRGNKTKLFPGVDYRGAGGYVVAPPSIGASGNRYRWTQWLDLSTVRG